MKPSLEIKMDKTIQNEKLKEANQHYRDRDFKSAFNPFLKAAEEGISEYQRLVGWMYYVPEGVTKNVEQAEYWFRRAASVGDAEAQFGLGLVLQNTDQGQEAKKWFELSVQQGFAASQYRLAMMYLHGLNGINVDIEKGQGLLADGAKAGHLNSMKWHARELMQKNNNLFTKIKGALWFVKFTVLTIVVAFKDTNSPRFLY